MESQFEAQGPRQCSADQEVWVSQRLEEFAAILNQINIVSRKFPGASQPMITGAIDGLINGVSIEIIRTLGYEPPFVNLRKQYWRW